MPAYFIWTLWDLEPEILGANIGKTDYRWKWGICRMAKWGKRQESGSSQFSTAQSLSMSSCTNNPFRSDAGKVALIFNNSSIKITACSLRKTVSHVPCLVYDSFSVVYQKRSSVRDTHSWSVTWFVEHSNDFEHCLVLFWLHMSSVSYDDYLNQSETA